MKFIDAFFLTLYFVALFWWVMDHEVRLQRLEGCAVHHFFCPADSRPAPKEKQR